MLFRSPVTNNNIRRLSSFDISCFLLIRTTAKASKDFVSPIQVRLHLLFSSTAGISFEHHAANQHAGAPASRNSAVSAYTLADIMAKQEFDFRFGEKSYFLILRDGRWNIAVGKIGAPARLTLPLGCLELSSETSFIHIWIFRAIHNNRRLDNYEIFGDVSFLLLDTS